jgi:hypothetical protein
MSEPDPSVDRGRSPAAVRGGPVGVASADRADRTQRGPGVDSRQRLRWVPRALGEHLPGSLSERWHEIQAMFIDDPRSSAESAAGLVDDGVQALIASVREQQDSLLAAWHGENAGTEELRAAVQHSHAFANRLADFTHET